MDSREEGTCLMKTHFLKPYVTSIDGPVAELPPNRFSISSSSSSSSELKDWFSKIRFSGFSTPHDHFISWAEKMEALHEPTWRKAGIFEAIKASTYKISKNGTLIRSLVEKWCPETKSFIFPWGEATITLEDVMVLLGFSVLGSPVFAPLESLEMREAVEKLEKVRRNIMMRFNHLSQVRWISSFVKGDDSVLEHEAFLAFWLSQFVFPQKIRESCVSKNVFPIAVRLARGEKIALAPSILASLYRDLSQIQAFAKDKPSSENLKVKSLFKLVQVWTWERFKKLRPRAMPLQKGEPRIARWNLCVRQNTERLRFDDFKWRPYAEPLKNWKLPQFYAEEGKWMAVDDSLDDEFVSFARCLRVAKLVGIGFMEDYYPHRVAMQFGLSQDLPGLVAYNSSFTEKEAWEDYDKPLDGLKLYIPSRLATTSVTARYQDWWLKSVSEFLSSEESTEKFSLRNTVDDDDAFAKVMPLTQVIQKLDEGLPANFKRCRKHRTAKNLRWEIKKCKIGRCGKLASEVSISELFQELVNRTSEHLRNKRGREDDDGNSGGEGSKPLRNRRRFLVGDSEDSEQMGEEDDGISSKAQKKMRFCDDDNITNLEAGSNTGDDTIAQQELEQRSEESNDGETENKPEHIPCNKNSSSDHSLGSNGGLVETAISQPETRQNYDDEIAVSGRAAEKAMIDECAKGEESLLHANGEKKMQICDGKVSINAEKNTTVNDDIKEAESWLHEVGERQRSNDERWKHMKLAIEELALNLEARMMKVEKTFATIRKWKASRNQIQTGV